MKIKPITKLLILLVVTKTITSGQYDGCVYTVGSDCQQCYRRHNRADRKGCGPLLPESDHCEIYTNKPSIDFNGQRCIKCKNGYSLVNHRGDVKSTCAPGIIKDCFFEVKSAFGESYCHACNNNEYAVYNTTPRYYCKNLSPSLSNCEIGGSVGEPNPNHLNCYKCKTGFAVNFGKHNCVKPNLPGCLQNDLIGNNTVVKGCLTCDVYNGYHMEPGNDRCVKDSGSSLETRLF